MTAPWEDPRVREGLERQLASRSALIAGGARALGWKVGFGAPAALEVMQITAPLLGFLTDMTLLESGTRVDVSGWVRGIVEFEVAVVLGSDLGAGASDEEARAAIRAVGPAIELADIDLPIQADQVAGIVAGDIFHRGVVLGEMEESRAGLDITGLVARVLIDGEVRSEVTDLEALTGPYPWIVSTVASSLAANGLRLRAGDVIITGSVIPPIPVTEGRDFGFVLEPFPSISVHVG